LLEPNGRRTRNADDATADDDTDSSPSIKYWSIRPSLSVADPRRLGSAWRRSLNSSSLSVLCDTSVRIDGIDVAVFVAVAALLRTGGDSSNGKTRSKELIPSKTQKLSQFVSKYVSLVCNFFIYYFFLF
jgi:hypothetical protein